MWSPCSNVLWEFTIFQYWKLCVTVWFKPFKAVCPKITAELDFSRLFSHRWIYSVRLFPFDIWQILICCNCWDNFGSRKLILLWNKHGLEILRSLMKCRQIERFKLRSWDESVALQFTRFKNILKFWRLNFEIYFREGWMKYFAVLCIWKIFVLMHCNHYYAMMSFNMSNMWKPHNSLSYPMESHSWDLVKIKSNELHSSMCGEYAFFLNRIIMV